MHYFHGSSLHEPVLRFGYDDYHRLLESTGQSPELSESTEHSSKPITLNRYSPHELGTKVLAYWVTTWMKNKVLVCYLNLDQILVGLSIST
jgi:hypothetical protein